MVPNVFGDAALTMVVRRIKKHLISFPNRHYFGQKLYQLTDLNKKAVNCNSHLEQHCSFY